MNKKIKGKGGIWVQVIKDSMNEYGDRVTTFQLHYPRFIHSEFMTHRMLSKNASSSRAIPVHKQLDMVKENPAMPIHWGLNEPGMQSSKEGDLPIVGLENDNGKPVSVQDAWRYAATNAALVSNLMWQDGHGYHKQIVNRLAEPFTFMNVVVTATDWENFLWLRAHKDAQPEICELAKLIHYARQDSSPTVLFENEWHLPYVDQFRDDNGMLQYCDYDGEQVYSLKDAKKISASCCAQVSYRLLDQSLDKAIKIFDNLVGSKPLHASPFEHQCVPFSDVEYHARHQAKEVMMASLEDIYGTEIAEKMASQCLYSANFRGFVQYRKSLHGENQTMRFDDLK